MNCGPAWVWGFGCGDWRTPEYNPPNYVTSLVYEYPVYVYYEGGHQLVELFLKDGNAFSVTDYWFVNDQVHFTTVEEDGTKPAEEVIGLDELDVQKTIDVNTRRGFRIVRRDEPLEQYLRDHPDANAPLLESPPKSEKKEPEDNHSVFANSEALQRLEVENDAGGDARLVAEAHAGMKTDVVELNEPQPDALGHIHVNAAS